MSVRSKAIVTFANRSGNYMQGLARLSDSLRYNFDGELIAYTNELVLDCVKHDFDPYAFKVYALKEAMLMGFDQVLWLDCSCFAVGNLQPIFDRISENDIVFQDSGHLLGNWTNDKTLKYFGISRDEAMGIKMIGNAGFLGFDFNTYKGSKFFHMWVDAQEAGLFKGAWSNSNQSESLDERCKGHRHDMSCSSAIIHGMGLLHEAIPGDEILQYAGPYDKTLNNSILIKAQGL